MRAVVALLVAFVAFAFAAPLLHSDSPRAIAGQYIVIFQDGLLESFREQHISNLVSKAAALGRNDTILSQFGIDAFQGYSAILSKETLAEVLVDRLIQLVEVDQVVHLNTYITQKDATWGIDRTDQKYLPLDGLWHYNSSAGASVNAYIIDTGIYVANNEFGGRAIWGVNYAGDGQNTDCNGHGTHVAGTVGGTVYGIAKKVTLYAVKVLTCEGSGTNAGVINGVTWAANHHKTSKKNGIANMSLGGGVSTALDKAVQSATLTGLNFAVAAGNEDTNACNGSPSRVAAAICVGATDDSDYRAYFSNYGTCVDLFAPGVDITAAWIGGVNKINTISGTSMATPHVAGVVALYLDSLGEVSTDTDAVHSWVTATATPNVVTDPVGSPNRLLYSPYM